MAYQIACSSTLGYRMSLEKNLDLIASLGFKYVDLLFIVGWAHIEPAELVANPAKVLSRVRNALVDTGLATAAISVAPSVPPMDRSAGAIELRRRETGALLELAHALGSRTMVIEPGGAVKDRTGDEVFEATSASFAEQAAQARAAGVTPALELHCGSPYETLEMGRKLLARVPDLRVVFDPSHQVALGLETRDLGWVMDNMAHVHLRDANRGKMVEEHGKGLVDFPWVLAELKRRDYNGFVAVEYLEDDGFDALESTRKLKAMLEQAVVR